MLVDVVKDVGSYFKENGYKLKGRFTVITGEEECCLRFHGQIEGYESVSWPIELADYIKKPYTFSVDNPGIINIELRGLTRELRLETDKIKKSHFESKDFYT